MCTPFKKNTTFAALQELECMYFTNWSACASHWTQHCQSYTPLLLQYKNWSACALRWTHQCQRNTPRLLHYKNWSACTSQTGVRVLHTELSSVKEAHHICCNTLRTGVHVLYAEHISFSCCAWPMLVVFGRDGDHITWVSGVTLQLMKGPQ